jgi:hypothetical protein
VFDRVVAQLNVILLHVEEIDVDDYMDLVQPIMDEKGAGAVTTGSLGSS